MSYVLERFGSVNLPGYDAASEIGAGPARLWLLPLPGGGLFDGLGSSQAPVGDVKISDQASLLGSSKADLETQFKTLRALIGKRDKLYRRLEGAGALEWCYARLANIRVLRRSEHVFSLDVGLEFAMISRAWYAESAQNVYNADPLDAADDLTTTGAESPAAYPVTLNFTHAGNVDQPDVTFTITAGSGNVTAVTIQNTTTGHQFSWSGTLAAGNSLVIDCGALSVKNNGADDYNAFTPPTNKEEWMVFRPGLNALSISITEAGTESAIRVQFYDAYA